MVAIAIPDGQTKSMVVAAAVVVEALQLSVATDMVAVVLDAE